MTTSTESESAPRWSPDGRYLSFLSSRPGKAKGNQVWLLDRNGGEAQQFTDVKGRLTSYDWSPDSKKLLLVMADRDPNDPADDERPAAGRGGPNAQGAEADRDRPLQVQAGRGGLPDAAAAAALPLRHGDQEGRGADRSPALEAAAPSWSPDGKWIAFMGALRQGCRALQHLERVRDRSARRARRRGRSRSTTACTARASRARRNGVPTARRLVYLQSTGAKQSAYNMNRLAVVPVAGGDAEDSRRQARSRRLARRASRRTARRFSSWWPTTAPNIRRACR